MTKINLKNEETLPFLGRVEHLGFWAVGSKCDWERQNYKADLKKNLKTKKSGHFLHP